jgi:hypothetical protein
MGLGWWSRTRSTGRDWEAELKAQTVNGEVVMPEGKYFVLGDNRDDLLDSRYVGFVDQSDIVVRRSAALRGAAGSGVDPVVEDLQGILGEGVP